jgi:SAM-dependent methyltransferase
MASFESRHSFLIRGIEAFLRLEIGLKREQVTGDAGPVVGEDPDHLSPHRAYVGAPEEWDLVAARQVTLLLSAGLRDTHRLVDIGCGSLRAGRMLIPYLRPGHYFGVEPNRWLVESGIEHELGLDLIEMKRPTFRFVDDFSLSAFGVRFDFALAHSVFSHAYPDLALTGLRGIAESLAPEGKLFATFKEGPIDPVGSGWLYPEMVPYTWTRLNGIIEESGLVARRLDWMQPRQSWFVAAHPNAEAEIDDLSLRVRQPLQRPGAGAG